MKKISDTVYDKALNNPEYISIMNYASYPFKRLLSPDVLSRCILLGLFEFLCTYNKLKSKPSTYLSKCIKWECLRMTHQKRNQSLTLDIPTDDADHKQVEECLSCLNNDEKQLVVDYYIGKYTYRELAQIHGCSHEHIRRKITGSLNKMREMVYN